MDAILPPYPVLINMTSPGVYGAQQLLAAEYVQRQVAVAVVVAVEEATLLLSVQWVVGGIEVQYQLFGGTVEAGDELIHQHLVQPPGRGTVGPLLQAAQGGCTGDLSVHAHGCLQGHVLAQRAVIVQVFPAQCESIHPLAQHVAYTVFDQERAARIGNAACGRVHQSQLAIHLPEQHHATIARHAAAVESSLHYTPAQSAKVQRSNVNFFGTVWLRHCPLV